MLDKRCSSIAVVVTAALLLPARAYSISNTNAQVQTMWEFFRNYTGTDKSVLLQQSFASARLQTLEGETCSGAMISPHIFLTAAHCGGPEWTGFVQFFRFQERAPAPAPSAQTWSARYAAHTFPWQSFDYATGGGDAILWWVEDGQDGIAPGIKYGYLELSPEAVVQGDPAYSFWVNPVDAFNLDWTMLYSDGVSLEAPNFGTGLGEEATYSLYGAPGCSGSLLLSPNHQHEVIGVTDHSPNGGTPRTAMHVRHLLAPLLSADSRRYDADRNNVLDAVENDLLFTRRPTMFRLISFDTFGQRAQWRLSGIPGGRSTPPGGWSSITTDPGFWVGHVVGSASDEVNDGLWHSTVRLVPNATYRIGLTAFGVHSAGTSAYIKLRTDSGGHEIILPFQPVTGGWKRFSFRTQIGNFSDYRMILGQLFGGDYYVNELSIVREDNGSGFNFETAAEREGWEYNGGSYVSSWGLGIGSSDNFSGVVQGHTPPWGLRNRHVALQPNHTYTIAFDTQHIAGPLSASNFVNVQNLSGVSVGSLAWQFSSPGEARTLTLVIATGNETGNTLTFGNTSDSTYMVDNIRVQEN